MISKKEEVWCVVPVSVAACLRLLHGFCVVHFHNNLSWPFNTKERTAKRLLLQSIHKKPIHPHLAFLRLHYQLHFLLDWKTLTPDRKKAILSMGCLAMVGQFFLSGSGEASAGEICTLSTIRYA